MAYAQHNFILDRSPGERLTADKYRGLTCRLSSRGDNLYYVVDTEYFRVDMFQFGSRNDVWTHLRSTYKSYNAYANFGLHQDSEADDAAYIHKVLHDFITEKSLDTTYHHIRDARDDEELHSVTKYIVESSVFFPREADELVTTEETLSEQGTLNDNGEELHLKSHL